MTHGRNKGNSAEREVAKLLKAWWSQVEPAEFVRVPLSGGWGGPSLRAGFKASGDVMTTAKLFPFSVEVKRRENFNLSWLLEGKNSPVWTWWEQAMDQADEMSVTPMLWFRQSRQPWRVMLPWDIVAKAQDAGLTGEIHVWEPWIINRLKFDFNPSMIFAEDLLKLSPSVFVVNPVNNTGAENGEKKSERGASRRRKLGRANVQDRSDRLSERTSEESAKR